jgi:hypothetical protein
MVSRRGPEQLRVGRFKLCFGLGSRLTGDASNGDGQKREEGRKLTPSSRQDGDMKPLIPDTNANEERVVARKIAVVVGSVRKESINRKLAKALIKLAPKNLECEFVRIDDLPVFNQDHDQNPPQQVARVKARIVAANVMLFVTTDRCRPH